MTTMMTNLRAVAQLAARGTARMVGEVTIGLRENGKIALLVSPVNGYVHPLWAGQYHNTKGTEMVTLRTRTRNNLWTGCVSRKGFERLLTGKSTKVFLTRTKRGVKQYTRQHILTLVA